MGARLIARRGSGIGSFEVRWQPHEELATTALITFKAHSTVRPGDDDTAVILNAFTEALSDLIEAFSNEVGSEIAVVKQSLLNKLQSEGGRGAGHWPLCHRAAGPCACRRCVA